jgi:DNA end-binding protein Ku
VQQGRRLRHIDKAYAEGSTTVVLTEEDLKSLPEERSKEIEVVEFVPSEQIDRSCSTAATSWSRTRSGTKAYALLRRTLEETDRTAIVQFSLRRRPGWARSGAGQGADAAVPAVGRRGARGDFRSLEDNPKVSPQELKMSASLVDNMATDFAPEKFSDEYQDQLKKLIAAKLEQGDKLDTAATFGEEASSPTTPR